MNNLINAPVIITNFFQLNFVEHEESHIGFQVSRKTSFEQN